MPSILQQYDYLNYQFTFEYYLYEKELNRQVLDFMSNNNLRTNYICFFDTIRDDKHIIITTDLKKDPENGYRIIQVYFNQMFDENKVFTSQCNIIHHKISYNNMIITISNKLDILTVEELVNININDVQLKLMANNKVPLTKICNKVISAYVHGILFLKYYLYDCGIFPYQLYDKDLDTSNITILSDIQNCRILSVISAKNAMFDSLCDYKCHIFNHYDFSIISKDNELKIYSVSRRTKKKCTKCSINNITIYHG
jgi:hypothetical protein